MSNEQNRETLDEEIRSLFRCADPGAIERDHGRHFKDRLRHRVWVAYKARAWSLEETIEVIDDAAHTTRSLAGYQVLYTVNLGIVDVDFRLQRSDNWGYDLANLTTQAEVIVAKLTDWSTQHPEQSWRVYRTAAGMRLVRTDAPQLLDDTFAAVCAAVGADKRYQKIAVEQGCFQARLTAKPHRVGLTYPRWNVFEKGGDGWAYCERFQLPMYNAVADLLAQQCKTCELVTVIGDVVAADLEPVIRYHDAACRVESTLDLERPHPDEFAPSEAFRRVVQHFDAAYRGGPPSDRRAPNLVWSLLSDYAKDAIKDLDLQQATERPEHDAFLEFDDDFAEAVEAAEKEN